MATPPPTPDPNNAKEYRDILKGITEEFSRQQSLTSQIRGEYRNLSKIAKDLANAENESNRLSDRQLNTLQAKARISLKELEANKATLKAKRATTDEERAMKAAAMANFKLEEKVLGVIEEQVKQRKRSNQLMGVAGGLIAGLNKVLGPLSKSLRLDEAKEDMQVVADRISKSGESFGRLKVLSTGTVGIFKSLGQTLTDPLVLLAGMASFINQMDKQATSLARNFAISKDQAIDLRNSFNDLAISSGVTVINTQDLINTQIKINNLLGTSVILNDKNLVALTQASEVLKLSEGAFEGLTKISLQTGENAEDIQNSILGTSKVMQIQNGLLLNQREVLEEVLSTSASLRVQFGNNTDEIAKAVTEAKMLGFNLKDIEGIQSNILNFESSIAAELEAELLTGKQLNLEKARYFALTGNIRGLTQEINKQLGGSAEFEAMNVIQREAFAKSLGLSVDRLSEVLYTQEQNLRLQQDLANNDQIREFLAKNDLEMNKESLLLAIKRGAVSKDILDSLGKQDREALSTLSIQERFNKAVLRLKDVFASIIDGPAGKLLTGLDNTLKFLDKSPALKSLAGVAMVGGIGAAILSLATRGTSVNPTVVRIQNALGGGGSGMFNSGKGGGRAPKGGTIINGKSYKGGQFLPKGAGGLSKLGKLGRMAGKAGPLALLGGGLTLASNLGSGMGAGESIGRAALAGLGGFAGGALGSLAGPLGTFAGGTAGYMGGEALGDVIFGSPTAMAVGGIVTQPTRALVGEAGAEAVIPLDEFNAKLDQLIAAVTANRDVYMDGRLVGDAVAARSFK